MKKSSSIANFLRIDSDKYTVQISAQYDCNLHASIDQPGCIQCIASNLPCDGLDADSIMAVWRRSQCRNLGPIIARFIGK